MPSHSVEQAKTMSAIAHGWKPKGSASGIPVKVAKEFHAADKGHKYGKGRPGMGGPDPMERSVAAPDVALVHRAAGSHRDGGFMQHGPKVARGMDRAPRKEGPAPGVLPAHARHGYGHDATQHSGHLRNSGHSGAHRIGKR
jgi:hypothetical protein